MSFGPALFVTIEARNIRCPERSLFYRALLQRLLRSPLSFELPTTSAKNPTP